MIRHTMYLLTLSIVSGLVPEALGCPQGCVCKLKFRILTITNCTLPGWHSTLPPALPSSTMSLTTSLEHIKSYSTDLSTYFALAYALVVATTVVFGFVSRQYDSTKFVRATHIALLIVSSLGLFAVVLYMFGPLRVLKYITCHFSGEDLDIRRSSTNVYMPYTGEFDASRYHNSIVHEATAYKTLAEVADQFQTNPFAYSGGDTSNEIGLGIEMSESSRY